MYALVTVCRDRVRPIVNRVAVLPSSPLTHMTKRTHAKPTWNASDSGHDPFSRYEEVSLAMMSVLHNESTLCCSAF